LGWAVLCAWLGLAGTPVARAAGPDGTSSGQESSADVTVSGDEEEVELRVTQQDASNRKIRVLTDQEVDEPEPAGSPVEKRAPGDVRIRVEGSGRTEIDADDKVAFGHDITIDYDHIVPGNVMCVFGSVTIHGIVEGEVVALWGDVEVGPTGRVGGEAVAIGGGDVRVASGGVVEGEAVAVGGRVRQDEDSLVGDRVEISFIPSIGPRFGAAGLFWLGLFGHVLIIGLAGWVLLGLSRMRSAVAVATLRVRGWESLLAGVGGALLHFIVILPLLVILGIVLVAIVIGIPLVPVLALLALVLPALGYVVTTTLVGLSVSGYSFRPAAPPGGEGQVAIDPDAMKLTRAYFLGHLLVSLPGLMSLLLAGLTGGPSLVSSSFLFLSFAIVQLACALGWGAILLSRFGRRLPVAAV
jgi:cytoskeletal protein CcmA (bactofilin family)